MGKKNKNKKGGGPGVKEGQNSETVDTNTSSTCSAAVGEGKVEDAESLKTAVHHEHSPDLGEAIGVQENSEQSETNGVTPNADKALTESVAALNGGNCALNGGGQVTPSFSFEASEAIRDNEPPGFDATPKDLGVSNEIGSPKVQHSTHDPLSPQMPSPNLTQQSQDVPVATATEKSENNSASCGSPPPVPEDTPPRAVCFSDINSLAAIPARTTPRRPEPPMAPTASSLRKMKPRVVSNSPARSTPSTIAETSTTKPTPSGASSVVNTTPRVIPPRSAAPASDRGPTSPLRSSRESSAPTRSSTSPLRSTAGPSSSATSATVTRPTAPSAPSFSDQVMGRTTISSASPSSNPPSKHTPNHSSPPNPTASSTNKPSSSPKAPTPTTNTLVSTKYTTPQAAKTVVNTTPRSIARSSSPTTSTTGATPPHSGTTPAKTSSSTTTASTPTKGTTVRPTLVSPSAAAPKSKSAAPFVPPSSMQNGIAQAPPPPRRAAARTVSPTPGRPTTSTAASTVTRTAAAAAATPPRAAAATSPPPPRRTTTPPPASTRASVPVPRRAAPATTTPTRAAAVRAATPPAGARVSPTRSHSPTHSARCASPLSFADSLELATKLSHLKSLVSQIQFFSKTQHSHAKAYENELSPSVYAYMVGLEADVFQAQATTASLRAENTNLKAALKTSEKSNATLSSSLQTTQDHLNAAKAELQMNEKRIRELEKVQDSLQKSLHDEQKKADRLENKVATHGARDEAQKHKMEALENSLREKARYISQLLAAKKEADRQVKTLEDSDPRKLAALTEEDERQRFLMLQHTIGAKDKEVMAAKAEAAQQQHELSRVQDELARLKASLEESKESQWRSLQEVVKRLTVENQKLKDSQKESNERIKALRNELYPNSSEGSVVSPDIPPPEDAATERRVEVLNKLYQNESRKLRRVERESASQLATVKEQMALMESEHKRREQALLEEKMALEHELQAVKHP